jgi:uncharacterized protein (DUF362 family)
MQTNVALVQGSNRYQNMRTALEILAPTLDLNTKRCVLIKPNLVNERKQLSNTHPEGVRALLDFLRNYYQGEIVIAEGAALNATYQSFDRFGYRALAEQYHLRLIDLNADEPVWVTVYDRQLKPLKLRLARSVVESDFRISICPPKTHNIVIVTLTLKNMIMGSLVNPAMVYSEGESSKKGLTKRFRQIGRWIRMMFPGEKRSDKFAMHQGFPGVNLNLAILTPWVQPHLALVDGFEGMEGNGPNGGQVVDWRIALAGTDAIAVDHLGTYLMGFDPNDLGYLNYCKRMGFGVGELDQINVLGGIAIESVRRAFKPHFRTAAQLKWQIKDVDRYLKPATCE